MESSLTSFGGADILFNELVNKNRAKGCAEEYHFAVSLKS